MDLFSDIYSAAGNDTRRLVLFHLARRLNTSILNQGKTARGVFPVSVVNMHGILEPQAVAMLEGNDVILVVSTMCRVVGEENFAGMVAGVVGRVYT
jgi:hypothetical protein